MSEIKLEDAGRVAIMLRCHCDDGTDCGTCEAVALCHSLPCDDDEYAAELLDAQAARIAKYEDTGISPDDINKAVSINNWEEAYKQDYDRMSVTLRAYCESGLSPERAAELGKADAEGRVRILPEAVSGTCGSCAYFHRAKGTRSGTCELRPYRVSKWSPAKYPFRPSQSQKGCKRYQEAARGEHNVDDTDQ